VERFSSHPESLKLTFQLAKFSIAMKEQNIEQTETFLKDLILQPDITYEMAINATKKWVEINCTHSYKDIAQKISEIFKTLAGKFPK
jgi:hypothetical protein